MKIKVEVEIFDHPELCRDFNSSTSCPYVVGTGMGDNCELFHKHLKREKKPTEFGVVTYSLGYLATDFKVFKCRDCLLACKG